VGYAAQKFEEGKFSFRQLKLVVDALEQLGENVFVVLPTKYTKPTFSLAIGAGVAGRSVRQVLDAEELAIQCSLMNAGKVYSVPPGFHDDFFSMVASTSGQNGSTPNDVYIDEPGRIAGPRPLLVTNDNLSDHVNRVKPRLFRRWFTNFVLAFDIDYKESLHEKTSVNFNFDAKYSKEIQSNTAEDGSLVWHFPIIEDDLENEWFCIRVPSKIAEDNEQIAVYNKYWQSQ
jgi:hypothetical protein